MEDRLKARTLLLAGMGEPGRFAQDSLQFIMSNIIVAIKAMGETKFAIPLLGIRRKELAIGQAVRGFIQGIDDGYEPLPRRSPKTPRSLKPRPARAGASAALDRAGSSRRGKAEADRAGA